MSEEIWKSIALFRGYEFSSYGRIRSLNKLIECSDGRKLYLKRGKVLSPIKNPIGYLTIGLSREGTHKRYQVHRLVAAAFLGLDFENVKSIVDHIDNNPLNNHVSNLQVTTQRNNTSKDRFRQDYTSSYIGVSWSSYHSRWLAQILINGKVEFLGLHRNEEDAAQAYQNKLKQLKEQEDGRI